MSEAIKVFFEKINNNEHLLLFRRLYFNPNSVLGSKQDMDEAEEEYNNLFDYCRLMMNKELIEFIKVLLNDEKFCNKADLQIWRKLSFFLYDSIEFKEFYNILDDDLESLFKEEITVIEYVNRKGFPHINASVLGIIDKYKLYKKYLRLIEYKYSPEIIGDYSEKEAENVRCLVNWKIAAIKEKTIDKQIKKEIVLHSVENDDYSEHENNNNFLSVYLLKSNFVEPYSLFPGICFKTFDSLVCENRFLTILEKKLEENKISGIALENAIEIISMGIKIKRFQEPDATFFRKRLGEELVKEFDTEKAEEILAKISLYKRKNLLKLNKVIKFPI